MLEYARPYEAVTAHCKGAVSYRVLTSGGEQEVKIIPEGDIYRLIIKAAEQSRNPNIKKKAERFERWVFDEVLPSIRKTGAYLSEVQVIRLDARTKALEAKIDGRCDALEALIQKLAATITLTSAEQHHVSQAVICRIRELLGPEYRERRNQYFSWLYTELKKRYGLGSYRDLRRIDFEECMNWIATWRPIMQHPAA